MPVRCRPVSRLLALGLLPLVGCGSPGEGAWMEGFGYGWDLFNHRVSALAFRADATGAEAAVVGGTSTTGISDPLPTGCDPDTCDEFPFRDNAIVAVDRVQLTSKKVQMAQATAALVATADGATATVEVPFDRRVRGEVVAVIGGWSLDTDHPLSGGDACYRPSYGWLPTRMALALGEPVVADDGRSASVTVTATFAAGLTLEDVRECLDAVVDQASVPVEVDVVVVAGDFAHDAAEVAHGVTYPYGAGPSSPDPQPDPDLAQRPLALDLDAPAVGWSAFDFAFHQVDADGRGAYLRTLSVVADVRAGVASGHATNYSPVTQQSGFDYAFSGRVVGVSVAGDVVRAPFTGTFTELVDDAGDPIVHRLE